MLTVCAALAGAALAQPADYAPAFSGAAAAEDAISTSTPDDLYSSPQQRRGFGGPVPGVYRARITPHWFQNDTRFWYRNDLPDNTKEFIVVDAEKGTRQPAFDHQKLAAALSKAASEEFKADRLPFSEIEFVADDKAIRFEAAGKTWKCDLSSYECVAVPVSSDSKPSSLLPAGRVNQSERAAGILPAEDRGLSAGETPAAHGFSDASPAADEATSQPARGRGRGQGRGEGERELRSRDGKWTAFVKEHNVFVGAGEGGEEIQLSHDGVTNHAYGRLAWAPDSQALVGWRIEPGDHKQVYLIQSSPSGGGRAVLRTRAYDLPGDKLTLYELSVFDIAARKQIKPEGDRFEHGWESPSLRWHRDNRHFSYTKVDRGHQRYRVIEVDSHTGALRNIIDERTDTFIWTAHTENLNLTYVNWLTNTDEIIYASERDGWRHLYLIDAKEGKIKNQITKGEWVVRGIDRIDEENRQIWFRASGRNADQDPYFIHYYRIDFDGSGLVALTEGNGNHSIQYSPDRKYIIDTYSRVDMAPVHELRRVSDGALVCKFEEADITELKASGWEPPEVFVAKGRDGKTDIWGIITRPRNLDPNKKYPVLESIYNGPQSSYVPKSFSGSRRTNSLAELGFVLVQMDAMGTANRSKAFHDVCWHNVKDAGFPDRILWHKAAAKKYPWYDITRVGIYGTSAGGQNAAAAVLFHPDFYKAAVANSGCHDNRMDKASWNEQWMGYPVGPQYAECSNIESAGKLGGYLMLIVGEMDDNVPPESTIRFVDALVKAKKDFELVVIPGANHGAASPITQRRLEGFFQRHLQGIEPPNRNAAASAGS